MKILAIETSCDDTSVALIEAQKEKIVSFRVLANIISSQVKIHKIWGGVYPALAMREHQKNLIPVFEKVLQESGLLNSRNSAKEKKLKKEIKNIKKILEREPKLLNDFLKLVLKTEKSRIDLISITNGPGLEPCLWVGVNFAKALSSFWKIPLIPVNHIEAHIYANFINNFLLLKDKKQIFPTICLIVSGGHTQLILMQDFGKYKILGETRDDAAGECLDKIARILGLEYPGGPIVEGEAKKFKRRKSKFKIKLPRPMIHSKDYDFSFSGLKTAVLYDFKKRDVKVQKNRNYIQEMCFESQKAIIDVLIKKTLKAAKDYSAKTIILGGGVSANQELRKQIKKTVKEYLPSVNLSIPDSIYCTDNAVMVGVSSYFKYLKNKKESWKKIKADSNLRLDK